MGRGRLIALFCLAVQAGGKLTAEANPVVAGPVLEYGVAEPRSGRSLYTIRAWQEKVEAEPKTFAAVSTTAFPQGNVLRARMILSDETPPRCLSWEMVITDREGTVAASYHGQVVAAAFPYLSVPLPPNTYPRYAPLGYVFTRLGLGPGQPASFFVVTDTSLARIDLWVEGQEKIEVPAGAFDCYQVRMRPNVKSLYPNLPDFVRPFVSFFIPTYTLWLTVADPHTLVQFAGVLGPPGSPEVIVRLASIHN